MLHSSRLLDIVCSSVAIFLDLSIPASRTRRTRRKGAVREPSLVAVRKSLVQVRKYGS
jgi:hypothetical protein